MFTSASVIQNSRVSFLQYLSARISLHQFFCLPFCQFYWLELPSQTLWGYTVYPPVICVSAIVLTFHRCSPVFTVPSATPAAKAAAYLLHLLGAASAMEKKLEALKGLRSLLIKAGKSVFDSLSVWLSDWLHVSTGGSYHQSALSASVSKESRG